MACLPATSAVRLFSEIKVLAFSFAHLRGQITGRACMWKLQSKSEKQMAAEAQVANFRKARGPFVVAADTTRMAMVFTDAKEPDNPIIFANDSFLTLSGYDREEVLGQSFNFLMARGADPKALALIEAAFAESHDHSSEISYRRKDGSVFCAAVFINPVRDQNDSIVEHFASFVDITQQKQETAHSDDDRRVEPSGEKYAFNGAVDCVAGFAKKCRSRGGARVYRIPSLCSLAVTRLANPREVGWRGARQSANSALAGEGWTTRYTTNPEGLWLSRDRARPTT
jgi:PAS domain S-box-containing protein